MKYVSSLIVAVPIAVAACAGGSSGDGAAATSTGEDELDILELRCRDSERIDGMRLDVHPGLTGVLEATLITDEGESFLLCTPSHVKSDTGRSDLLVSCVEKEGVEKEGIEKGIKKERVEGDAATGPANWSVEIFTEPDGRQAAHIERHEVIDVPGFGEDLACSRLAAAVPVLPYTVIQGYLDRTCGICHEGRFDSLEKVRAERDLMFGMISAGVMPKRNPSWRTSDEGQLTLAFLAKSAELE